MTFRSDLEALILAALVTGPKHGYGIVKSIREGSEDVLKLGEAQLYPILHRIEEEGHVKGEWIATEGRPSRKVYRLTGPGTSALARKRKQWDEFKGAINKLMLSQPTGGN